MRVGSGPSGEAAGSPSGVDEEGRVRYQMGGREDGEEMLLARERICMYVCGQRPGIRMSISRYLRVYLYHLEPSVCVYVER